MTLETWLQYGSMVVAILFLIFKWKGMKKYIPAGLFACFYANIWCHIAMTLNWWSYSSKITEIPVNCIVTPIMTMFWIRYSPIKFKKQILWALLWTTIIMVFEFVVEKSLKIIKYHSGYNWVHSYLFWFFSWFIWYYFHLWFTNNNGRKQRFF